MNNFNNLKKRSIVCVSLFYLFFLSGCATQMLHEKINGSTKKQYPTVIKNHFLFTKVIKAELDTDFTPYVLFLCVKADDEQANQENNNKAAIKEYFLSTSIMSNNLHNNLIVEEFSIGCDNKFNPKSNRLPVSLSIESIPAYVPSPIADHAADFNLAKIYIIGRAGSLTPANEVFPSRILVYRTNDPLIGGITKYNISIRLRNTIIPVPDKVTEFSSKDLLAVFYPFTLVWDVITTPFIYLYLYINNVH